ncbi:MULTISPECIES: glycosyltransferase [Prochlorococcus]|uniref:Glycosyltransferase n=1 Tax=Prochlorococcus marinus (strain SARG / CCMP1375 / SS120) TaxID=167539 RepID=Q7VAR5_PROMA|nr:MULTISPECIES: glycosyltransferase [Prochlorococcus]AAQ00436.1 Glycosyltransferase [Prochlorococcus marinus subsp. marinus str. CCMP1375]KGG14318.1 Glycosyltransferase [Prochlorococcus marinus str. LG]KGG22110.1 Glycosyltransferase [Prochlorococcus marinus str. SS2]KGG24573.1 Glycosyltransferase [Prochlorococcus marinus str. SS35]KGG33467.1 Glycosyltransferase [Prochlorococcus marinus str. SS51]
MHDFPKDIALVHEWFSPRSSGGSEQVVRAVDEIISSLGSSASLCALIDAESIRSESWLSGRSVNTSCIQGLPFGISHVQSYLPLLPYAIEQIDLKEYPLVISSSHLVAKGVLTSPDQLHLSYIHTPVRYAWDQMEVYLQRSFLRRIGCGPVIRWQLHKLRQWDQLSSARVDCLLANSRFTARRILKYWGRESIVVHPPVDVDRFTFTQDRDDYYLCLCRLVPNKKVDLVVRAFNSLGLPLLIVGDGPERSFLKRIAGPNVKIMGYQNKQIVEDLMQKCRAYVYAGVEDFGIAPVEAMASGAPVIALGKGGLLDTVRCASRGIQSSTGILFQHQKVQSLIEAINWFEEKKLWEQMSSEAINEWAQKFSHDEFSKKFEVVLNKAWHAHLNKCTISSSDPFEFKKS